MRVFPIFAALVLTIAACATDQENATDGSATKASTKKNAPTAVDSGSWTVAKEANLRTYWSNKTMFATTRDSGREIRIYYSPQGKFQGECCAPMWNSSWDGVWTVKGDEFCQTWKSGNNAGRTRCLKFLANGQKFKLKDPKQSTVKNVTFKLGNKLY